MATPGELPREDEGRGIWERLRDGDPVAPLDLAMTYLFPLLAWLRQHYPATSEDDRSAAADDAIVNLCLNPAIYNPAKQTLEVFLRMAAAGDLKNLIRAEGRHAMRRASLEAVELSTNAGKYLADETEDPAALVEAAEVELAPELSAMLDDLPDDEKKVLLLMADGERRTAAFATALGISGQPPPVQSREVKRVKDRLKKRLERWKEKQDG